LKRPRQLERGMFAVIKLGRSRDECRSAGGAHIRFENLVGIVKKTQDQIEAREVIGQLDRPLRISGEKSGERTRFQRANRICVETFFSQRGDRFGAQDFKVRIGKSVSEQFDRGQREDEIADRAAADDQDAIQVSSA
jgi:hypothetical protein